MHYNVQVLKQSAVHVLVSPGVAMSVNKICEHSSKNDLLKYLILNVHPELGLIGHI